MLAKLMHPIFTSPYLFRKLAALDGLFPFPQAIPTTNYNNAEEDNMVEGGRATMLKEPGSLSNDMEQNCPTNLDPGGYYTREK